MANTLANLARMYTETTGTGTLTLTTAVPSFLSFDAAGVANGATVTYAIYCGPHREIGAGVYTASGLTLTRATVYSSTNGGSKISLTGRSEVFITAAKEDFDSFTTDLTAHLNDTSDAHDASAISFTPAGNVAATDVQAAIAELDSEKLATTTAASTYQPLDADLTAIAALSGTNNIYYRSAANTWSSVTVSANLGFSAGTLGSSLGTAATYNVGTSGGTVPLLNTANTFSARQNITDSASFSTLLGVISTNADALAGPIIDFNRDSASPADSDRGGTFNFRGNNTTPASIIYAQVGMQILQQIPANEFGQVNISTIRSGTLTQELGIRNGCIFGSPTGGAKGAGTINAAGSIYVNNSLVGVVGTANTWTAAQTIRVDSAATNSVTAVATLSSTSTGTPAAGIGVGLNFEAETAAGNNEIGARISAVTTDVTAASEDFDIVFSAMAAGAAVAEVGRITSKGTYKHPSFTVAGLPAGTAGETAFASNGRKNGEGAAAGTGVLVFHDGTAWRACDTGATVAA